MSEWKFPNVTGWKYARVGRGGVEFLHRLNAPLLSARECDDYLSLRNANHMDGAAMVFENVSAPVAERLHRARFVTEGYVGEPPLMHRIDAVDAYLTDGEIKIEGDPQTGGPVTVRMIFAGGETTLTFKAPDNAAQHEWLRVSNLRTMDAAKNWTTRGRVAATVKLGRKLLASATGYEDDKSIPDIHISRCTTVMMDAVMGDYVDEEATKN